MYSVILLAISMMQPAVLNPVDTTALDQALDPVAPGRLARFPSLKAALDGQEAAKEHLQYCKDQLVFAQAHQVDVWRNEIIKAREIAMSWEHLVLAHYMDPYDCECYDLELLKEYIGAPAFAHGAMPAPVPYWRMCR